MRYRLLAAALVLLAAASCTPKATTSTHHIVEVHAGGGQISATLTEHGKLRTIEAEAVLPADGAAMVNVQVIPPPGQPGWCFIEVDGQPGQTHRSTGPAAAQCLWQS
jgi:hypothetical protein